MMAIPLRLRQQVGERADEGGEQRRVQVRLGLVEEHQALRLDRLHEPTDAQQHDLVS